MTAHIQTLKDFQARQKDCGFHSLRGKRRYRKGKGRCRSCGGFLLVWGTQEFAASLNINYVPRFLALYSQVNPLRLEGDPR